MRITELSLPHGWDDITAEWMTAALAHHHPDAVVDDVTVALRDDGTNRRARLGLTYSAGSGPATVFAKAVDPEHAELVALTSGLYHEPRLFSSGIELPLDHPTVYAALIDEDRSDFLMIMEDVVARGADPRDSTRPMSIDQVANGVRGLARMHSCFWGERLDTYPTLAWLEPFVAFEGMQYAPLHIAHERLGDTVPAEIPAMSGTELFVDIWARYIGTLTGDPESPPTLLHGDPHIGNTYVLPDDDVGFLDWQMARRGNWSLDLGYFLQGALTIEDRRRGRAGPVGGVPRRARACPPTRYPARRRSGCGTAHPSHTGWPSGWPRLSGGDAWQSAAISVSHSLSGTPRRSSTWTPARPSTRSTYNPFEGKRPDSGYPSACIEPFRRGWV